LDVKEFFGSLPLPPLYFFLIVRRPSSRVSGLVGHLLEEIAPNSDSLSLF